MLPPIRLIPARCPKHIRRHPVPVGTSRMLHSGHASNHSVEKACNNPVYCSGGRSDVIGADVMAFVVGHSSKDIAAESIEAHDEDLDFCFASC